MKHKLRFFAVLIVFTILILGKGVTVFADSIMTMPADLKIIDAQAFFGDTSIDQVVLQNGTVEIRAQAFANSSLRIINLPNSLTFIAEDAFQNSPLENVTANEGTYAYQWAVDHGYVDHGPDDPGPDDPDPDDPDPIEELPPLQCATEGVVFNALTQNQLDAVAGERDRLNNEGPAAYFGSDVNVVFRLDAVDADVDPDSVLDDNKVELRLLTGLSFSEGDIMMVILGVNGENGGITWTSYEGIAGADNETVATVDADTLDNASYIALGV